MTPVRPDWSHTSQAEIETGIAATRERLEAHLRSLRDKLSPPKLRRYGVPAAMAAIGIAAAAVTWIMSRKPAHHGLAGKVSRLKVRSAGLREQILALRLLIGVIRKGKPGVFILEPAKG